jgi:DNA segregation ATPase FtsK/SpoIIIE, S-DNA-T family
VMRMATVDELISLGVPRQVAAGPRLGDGRCFMGGSVETQIATVSEDPGGVAQAEAIGELARRLVASGVSAAPALPSLPSRVELRGDEGEPLHFALGRADLTLETVEVDLTSANFVVTGPPLSGRSTALRAAVAGLRAGTPGVRLVGVGSLTSPLAQEGFWDLAGFGRAQQSTALAKAAELVGGYEGAEARVVLVIDSVEDVDAMELNVHLEPLVRSDAVRVLAACDTGTLERAYSGCMTQLKRNRTVLVLQPASVADIEEQTRARPSLRPGQEFPPGRGVVVSRGQATLVQVGYPH